MAHQEHEVAQREQRLGLRCMEGKVLWSVNTEGEMLN